MRPGNLSNPSLIPNVLTTMKGYGEKKANLRKWALKSTRTAVVKNIIDLDLNQQEKSKTQASASLSNECRRIAVFGV